MLGNYWIDRPLPKRRPIAVHTVRYSAPQPVVKETSAVVKPKAAKVEKAKTVAKKAALKKVDSQALLKKMPKISTLFQRPPLRPKLKS